MTKARKTVNRAATAQPAAASIRHAQGAIRPVARAVQASSVRVSSPHDSAEQEADSTAKKIMRMAAAHPRVHGDDKKRHDGKIQRRADEKKKHAEDTVQHDHHLQRKAEGHSGVKDNVLADIRHGMTGGAPLSPAVRGFMEPRFGADFSNVRIHTDTRSERLNRDVSARAFTYGNHIFFGRDQYQPDHSGGRELIAHELTHTIQQGASPQTGAATSAAADNSAVPAGAGAAAAPTPGRVDRSANPRVTTRAPSLIQRLGLSDALNYFADHANLIPGFRLFTIVLGRNPINMEVVERSPANILRALVEFIPGGGLVTRALDNYGVFDKVGRWVSQQIATLGMTLGVIRRAIMQFVHARHWTDLFHLGDVWRQAKHLVTDPILRLINFGKSLITGILGFVKQALMLPLARLAARTRGWDLLIAVLGHNPITGDPVPQTAQTLIPGFLKLIGQEDIWQNMQRAHALPRAWAWFRGALGTVKGYVARIPALFIAALQALQLADIVLLPRAFARVAGVFGNFIGSFIGWAGRAMWNLLEIIFDVVSPGAFAYVRRTGAALHSILRNPMPFVHNLVRAAKLGFHRFAAHFLTHLKAGLIEWLTGALPGVYIPKSFTLKEVAKFVFSVLGLTWQQIRAALVRRVGERAVQAMEAGFDIVKALVTEGPAAAWDKMKEHLANLKDQVIDGITQMVSNVVVKTAVPKLIAKFVPGVSFITNILSIYDIIMVFVHKLARIVQVVTGFINSIVKIAQGKIAPAAAAIENALTGVLSLAISFLAGFLGIGNIADKVKGVIDRVRAPVVRARDKFIDWVVNHARRLGRAVVGGVRRAFGWDRTKSNFSDEDGKSHSIYVAESGTPKLMIASTPMAAEQFLNFYLSNKNADYKRENAGTISELRSAMTGAKSLIRRIDPLVKANPEDARLQPLQRSLLEKNVQISGLLSALIKNDRGVAKAREKYKLEGLTGTYASIPKPPGDDFTADHQPQAAILQAAAQFDYFSDTGQLAHRAARRAREGYAINLYKKRHEAGRTYGAKGRTTKQAFLSEISAATRGTKGAAAKRRIVVDMIRGELNADVSAMISVAGSRVDSPNWADVMRAVSNDKKQASKLVGEIRGRIIAGERQIKAQNIDSLIR